MQVLTFQHRDILKDLREKGIYIATLESDWSKHIPLCYNAVFNDIKIKEKGAFKPIFGWYKAIDFKNNDIKANNKIVSDCLNNTSMPEETYYLFVLDIEKDRLSFQNFGFYLDAMDEEMGEDIYYEDESISPKEEMFNTENAKEIQCTFASIRKEDIQEIYTFEGNEAGEWFLKNTIKFKV